MNIAFFSDLYEPTSGGTQTSLLNYKNALEKLGHRVYVVAPAYPKYIDTEPNVIRLASLDSFIRPGVDIPYRAIRLGPEIPKLLRDLDLDIVHSQTPTTAGVLAD